MKQTNFQSIVHCASCIVHSALNSALCIQHSALRLALLFVLILGVGNAWGGTATIATNDLPTSYSTGDKTVNEITYYVSNVANYGNGMQFKSTPGYIYNKTELPNITNIELTTQSGKTGSFNITVGSSQNPSTNSKTITNGKSYSDVPANCGYFKVTSSGTAYIASIIVTYGSTEKYTVTYHVAATSSSVKDVVSGTTVSSALSGVTTTSCSAESDTFVGWSTAAIDGSTDEKPSTLLEATAKVTSDMEVWAVWAKAESSAPVQKTTTLNLKQSSAPTSPWTDTNTGAVWTFSGLTFSNSNSAGMPNGSWAQVVFPSNSTAVTMTENGAGNSWSTSNITLSLYAGDKSTAVQTFNDKGKSYTFTNSDNAEGKYKLSSVTKSSKVAYVGSIVYVFTVGGTTYSKYITSCTASSKTTISYNKNTTVEVTGTLPASVEQTNGEDYTVSTSTLLRTGYNFVGWNTDKDASTAISTIAGSNITGTPITLYAIWKEYTITGIALNTDAAQKEFYKGATFNHSNVVVTASYSDADPANVSSLAEFSSPDMTTEGEKTVTVTYRGKEASYKINVKSIANTQETAYTVAQAKELIDAGNDLDTKVYVKGIVSSIYSTYVTSNGQISFYISNDGQTSGQQFEFYNCLPSENGKFTALSDVVVKDEVIGYGKMKKFTSGNNTIYEFDSNCYLVYQLHPAPQVSIADITVDLGDPITPKITGADGFAVSYESNNTGAVKVNDQGQLETIAAGEATITATFTKDSYKPATTTFKVTVKQAYTITATLTGATADGENATKVYATDEEVTLKYNLNSHYLWDGATLVVKMGETTLIDDDEYTWNTSKTPAELWIAPDGGFNGNISITLTAVAETAHKITLYNNGSTEGLTPTEGLYSGDAYGTLPVLESSAACHPTYKAFIGWTTSPISGTSASAPTLAKSTDVIDKADVNLYAVWAEAIESAQTTYNKITDLSTLVAGDKVVFVGTNSSNATYAMKAYDGTSNNVSSVSVTITNNTISDIGQACAYTLGGTTGSWTLFDGTYYLYAASSSKNYLKGQTSIDANAKWSFTMQDDGVYILSNTTENRGWMKFNYNSGSTIFACYATDATISNSCNPTIYRKPGTTYSNYYTNCSNDPTYTLSVNQPAAGGTIGVSQTKAYASTAITLSNNATAGYSFQKYILTKKSDDSDVTATYISGNTLTMPAFDVNLTATFPAKEVESISLSKDATTLGKDSTEALPTVNYLPADLIADKKGVNWSSLSESVAKVENGNIVGVGKGQTTITATSKSNNSKTASITVTVYEWVSTGYKMTKEGATTYTNVQTYSASAWEVSESFKRSDNESTKDVVVDAANVTVTFGGEAIADGYQFKIADNTKKLVFKVGETTVKEYTITVTAVPEDTFTDNIFSTVVTSQTGTYNLPSIDNQTKGEEATCQDHNIFMGWVTEANKNTPTDDNILKAGTEVTAANTKYFAVWAYDASSTRDVVVSKTGFLYTERESGSIGTKVSYSTGQGDGTSTVSADGTELLLYQANSGKDYGNYLTLTSATNYTLKSVKLTATGGEYGYVASAYSSTASYTTGTVPTSGPITISGLTGDKLTVVTKGTGKSNRLHITNVEVTYNGFVTEYTDYLAVCAERHEASYNANGGTGSYDATNYAEGVTFNLPDGAALTYDDHKFAGWKANNAGDLLAGGAEYTMGENDVKFYAQWNACTAQSLNVNSTGATLYFKEGETFSSKGLVVTAHRDYCEDDVTVNDWTTDYDGYVFQHSDDGDKTVTVSSESLQAQGTYTIHVTKQCQLVYNVNNVQFAVKATQSGEKIVFPDAVPADMSENIKFLGWSSDTYSADPLATAPTFVDLNTIITEGENVFNAVFGNVSETEDDSIVIKKASLLSTGASYSWLSWKQDEISGQMYAATDDVDQIKFKYDGGFGSAVFNAVYVPGDIKSISMKRNDSSSDRNWNAWVLNTAATSTSLPTSTGLGVKVFKAGETITWNIEEGSYRYFTLQQQQGGGSGNAVANITITYEKPTSISKYFMSTDYGYYSRPSADFSKGTITTICLPNAVKEGNFTGCTVYEVAGKELVGGVPYKIFFDQVFSMEAGKPYVIELDENATQADFYYSGADASAQTVDGLVGTFAGVAKAEYNDLNDNYIVYQNQIKKCGKNCSLGANKAYIVMGDVPEISTNPTPAPGRRRIALGNAEVQTPTYINTVGETDLGEPIRKLVIDNQLIIIRGGKMYNAAGALVK